MAIFLSTYVNKVDRKGRVSVPASFRAQLTPQNQPGIVVFRSFKLPALEAGGFDRMEEMSRRLETLEQFSEEYDSFSALFADMQQLPCDPEGRIMLPGDLAEYAGITDSAAFVGGGPTFQIWQPQVFARHQAEVRAKAKEKGLTFPARRPGEGS